MRSRLVINPAATGDTAADQVEQPTRATGEIRERPGRELPERRHRAVIGGPTTSYRLPRWLGLALDAGSRTRLLAWRRGLHRPLESAPIPGQVVDPAPLTVQP